MSDIKDILNIILTLILTAATVFLAVYTYRLVDESRRLRKAQAQPIISIHIDHAETDQTLLFIIVKNIGQGIAYNLKFHIKKDIGDYRNAATKISERGLFKEGMKFCPPGYTRKYFLMETTTRYEDKMKEEIILSAKYKNIFNESVEDNFHLKLTEQSMVSTISPADTHIGRIAENLKEIHNLLKNSKSL